MTGYASIKRNQQKLATRGRILQAAKQELEEKGYEAANIRSIAEQSGVAVGTVLKHFQSKQDLFHSALFDDLAEVWERTKSREPTLSLAADFTSVAEQFYAYYARRPSLSRALLRESLFADPPWNREFTSQIADVNAVLANWASLAVSEGRLAKDVNPALLAASFLSFYYFALLGWMQGALLDPLPVVRAMLDQHLIGLQKS